MNEEQVSPACSLRLGKLKLALFGAVFVCLAGSLLAMGFSPPWWVYPAIVGVVTVVFSVKVLKELRVLFRPGKGAR